jgi:hypothetical protein
VDSCTNSSTVEDVSTVDDGASGSNTAEGVELDTSLTGTRIDGTVVVACSSIGATRGDSTGSGEIASVLVAICCLFFAENR